MKYVVVALLFISAALAYQTYAPGEGPFAHLSNEEFAEKYLMQINDFDGSTPPQFDKAAFEAEFGVDSSFDLRTDHAECVSPIRDQAGCGGCWAFAITSLISDRECYQNDLETTRFFSPQHLIDCEGREFGAAGCQGADTQAAFGYTDIKQGGGLRLDECYPYESGSTGKAGSCAASTCPHGDDLNVYTSTNTQLWNDYDNVAMAKAIKEQGTIYMSMQVYESFPKYKGGVYRIGEGEKSLGGHAIRVIGWDSDEQGQYWIAANQWNENWGEDGYFRIGFNEAIGYKAGAADFGGAVDSFTEFY